MSRIFVPITPSVLTWCRRKSGLTLEAAAAQIGRPKEEIEKWEDGSLCPSLPQARKASEIYKRPLAIFLLPEPPSDFSTLRDFRRLSSDAPKTHSPELVLLIREAQNHQHWVHEYFEQENIDDLSFVGSATLSTPRLTLADRIRDELNISIEDHYACPSRDEALKLWIAAAEDIGIFIFRQGTVPVDEVRGFALCDELAPFIFLNSKDAKAAQLFTLVHELVHVWLNAPGISNLAHVHGQRLTTEDKIEVYCNAVAAETLVNSHHFLEGWKALSDDEPLEERISALSKTFKVSDEVIARRLLEHNFITDRDYRELRESYRQRWIAIREKTRQQLAKSDGGPSYYRLRLNKNGTRFTQLVLSAYTAGRVSGRETSSLLSVKLNNLSKMSDCAGFPV